jgi:hypothetical protein
MHQNHPVSHLVPPKRDHGNSPLMGMAENEIFKMAIRFEDNENLK